MHTVSKTDLYLRDFIMLDTSLALSLNVYCSIGKKKCTRIRFWNYTTLNYKTTFRPLHPTVGMGAFKELQTKYVIIF